ncbi:S41 family peptidase [Bergeyella porcorum]|uniref:S41 family peptidase n=1 Tax=Bergeyella porcorum TaxID=1735111 RepID=UPI0035EB4037
MKKILLFQFILAFSFTNIFGQQKKITVSQMKSDIDSLVKNINEIHINPYYKFPKKDFDKEILELKRNLKEDKDIFEFWKYIAPTVAKIEDGHTFLEIPYDEFYKINPKVFPFAVVTSLKKPYIKIIEKQGEIPQNTEITSINGVSSQKIVSELVKYISGEDKQTKAEWIAYDFGFLIHTVLGLKESCKITYKIKNTKFQKKIDFIAQDEFYRKNSTNYSKEPYTLEIIPKISTAIIDFNSFSNPDKMKIFADSTFTEIKNKNIKNLIIDIRKNGGGNSSVGDVLLQYLARTDFRQYSDNTLIKISNQVLNKIKAEKEEILKNKNNYSLNDSLYLNQIDRVLNEPLGKVTIAHYAKNTTKLEKHKNRFDGNLFLLTSRVTYSSASDFAQTIKAYHIGKIIGTETGGWVVCYGDSVENELPNSNLRLYVSSVKFVNEGAKPEDWNGVKPDQEVKPEKALEFVIKNIENNQ